MFKPACPDRGGLDPRPVTAECASIAGVSDRARSIDLLDDTFVTSGRDPVLDAAIGPALMERVARQGGPETLRIYRPRPTLGFSGRDAASPGIGGAVAAARASGFVPIRRGPGGRAAAYHRGALCLDHVGPDVPVGNSSVTRAPQPSAPGGIAVGPQGIRPRFVAFGTLLVDALRTLGVPAGLGPVPGEYCPGEFSINDGHGHKLVGTAQRLVRGGWLFGTVILVTDPEPVREVLIEVYDALGLEWDPSTVGAVETTVPGVSVDDVKSAVLAAYAGLGRLVPGELSDDVVLSARSRVDRHRLPG